MFTHIWIVFNEWIRNYAASFVRSINKLIHFNNNAVEEKSIASDWQRIGDDLRRGIISYGRSKVKQKARKR